MAVTPCVDGEVMSRFFLRTPGLFLSSALSLNVLMGPVVLLPVTSTAEEDTVSLTVDDVLSVLAHAESVAVDEDGSTVIVIRNDGEADGTSSTHTEPVVVTTEVIPPIGAPAIEPPVEPVDVPSLGSSVDAGNCNRISVVDADAHVNFRADPSEGNGNIAVTNN